MSQLQKVRYVVANGQEFIISDEQGFVIYEFKNKNFIECLKKPLFFKNIKLVAGTQ